MTEMTQDTKAAQPCWYVKDFADGWIKYTDVKMAIMQAKETGAVMLYAPDGKAPIKPVVRGAIKAGFTPDDVTKIWPEAAKGADTILADMDRLQWRCAGGEDIAYADYDSFKSFIASYYQTIRWLVAEAALKSPPQPAPEVVELVWQKVVDQCDEQMSYANHKKAVAEADYHNSEIYHQEGRWHCANDIQEWAEAHLQRQRGE